MADLWEDLGGGGLWSSCFTRHVNDWELEVVVNIFSMLRAKTIRREVNDKVIWKE